MADFFTKKEDFPIEKITITCQIILVEKYASKGNEMTINLTYNQN